MESEMIILLVATLSGAIIGGSISIIITLLNKRAEDRRHLRETLIKTAMENWKISVKIVQENARSVGKLLPIYPLDDYIIHFYALWNLLTKKKIGQKDIDEVIKKAGGLNKMLEESRKKYK